MNVLYSVVKMILGVIGAIIIAQWLKLDYALSCGVIAMLSILHTKRQSLEAGIKRIMMSIIGIGSASLLFYLLGFELWVLAIFIALFVPITLLLKAEVGLAVNTVLILHLFGDNIVSLSAMFNEFMLMLIGVSIGIILNLHMPNYEKELQLIIHDTEEEIKGILRKMGLQLVNLCSIEEQQASLDKMYSLISTGQDKAYQYMNNAYFKDNSYYAAYFAMRKAQYDRLKDMEKYFVQVVVTLDEAELLKDYTMNLADKLNEINDGAQLLSELDELKQHYKERPLPETREAFENRAMLYQYLHDIENFIEIKADFGRKYNMEKRIKYKVKGV